jgi:transposase-like protein
MEDYPRSAIDFQQRFSSEEACWTYLFQIRWPNGFVCPRCGFTQAWEKDRRHLLICRHCRTQTSVTSGTIFHGTRKPLRLWFHAIWYITSQKYGANALGLKRVLELGSYQTAWEWLHCLRRAMLRPGRERLSGLVEIDETYIGGKRPGKRVRGAANKALVIIAVEDKDDEGFGRIRLDQIADASSASITPFVQQNIEPGSIVRTDGWKGYPPLTDHGYIHVKHRSTANVGEDLLPLAHRIASLLKRWLMGTYQGAVLPKHLDYYLDEYTFRFNRRTSVSRGKLFYRLIQQAMRVEPIHGYDL